jgi:hypothetical protein
LVSLSRLFTSVSCPSVMLVSLSRLFTSVSCLSVMLVSHVYLHLYPV